MEPTLESAQATPAHHGEDRRQHKEDLWSRILRYIAMVIYPLLAINLLVFLYVASQDHQAAVSAQVMGQEQAVRAGHAAYFRSFLPVMITGLVVGAGGILIDRRRSRRRRDLKHGSQLICIILSAVGVALYFLFG